MTAPEIAIVAPNTLTSLGLQNLLEEIIPMATIRVFRSFAELMDDTPDMYAHYFISSQIYFEHTSFFLPRKPKTIVLAGGDNQPQLSGVPTLNIYQDEPTDEETVLWEGFYGVPKMTDIIKDGVSNPYGTILDQGFGDGDPQEEEANNEETDGITNEDAGIDEDDATYEEDAYGMEDLEDQIRR